MYFAWVEAQCLGLRHGRHSRYPPARPQVRAFPRHVRPGNSFPSPSPPPPPPSSLRPPMDTHPEWHSSTAAHMPACLEAPVTSRTESLPLIDRRSRGGCWPSVAVIIILLLLIISQVWTDPDAAQARAYAARRVLRLCRTQGRGRLAGRLVRLAQRLAEEGGGRRAHGTWPDREAFLTALQAVSRAFPRRLETEAAPAALLSVARVAFGHPGVCRVRGRCVSWGGGGEGGSSVRGADISKPTPLLCVRFSLSLFAPFRLLLLVGFLRRG